MSIGDFQKAWAQRFPGCELPQQWEDDVRANLSKHRQKVAALNEELEKEEFYVEYLEHLLADVERAKLNPKFTAAENENRASLNHDPDPQRPIVNSNERKASHTSKDGNLGAVQYPDPDNERMKRNTPGERNSYVTVISVGGPDNLNDAGSPEKDCNENPTPVTNNRTFQPNEKGTDGAPASPVQKKKPPAPPKKPRKSIPVQAVPPVQKELISTPESEVAIDKPLDAAYKNHDDDVIHSLVNHSTESGIASNYSSRSSTTTSSSIIFEPKDAEVKSSSENIHESISYSDENIYDTVAADEESTDAQTSEEPSPMADSNYVEFTEPAETCSPSVSSRSRIAECLLNTQKSMDEDNPDFATYMNIDYFLQNQKELSGHAERGFSAGGESDEDTFAAGRKSSSDHETEPDKVADYSEKKGSGTSAPADDVFDMDSGVYSSSVESTSFIGSSPTTSVDKKKEKDKDLGKKHSDVERVTMFKCILGSIVESEAVYIECLNTLLQYMKALKSTIGTSQPLLSLDDFNTIFYRIPELHNLHQTFLKSLKKHSDSYDGSQVIGEDFKILASKLGVYGSFLQNYSKAIETVRKCSTDNAKFSEITKTIKLKALPGQATSLEDLLHKPVARVQKNALVLHDLLQNTTDQHQDYKPLRTALKMTQCFLNDINVSATESMFPVTDRAQRHLVKNTFIVELSEGHRKLRHLFLFNDVIVCARYKPATRQKFTFEVKWFIPLCDAVLLDSSFDGEPLKESSPFDILSLKSRASNIRDQILKEEKGKERRIPGRNVDKLKKKLAELEAQLVLASPNLIFRLGQKCLKSYTFFLSSEFERSQWSEAINVLQTAAVSTQSINLLELQTWVASCRQHLGANLGSFLLRSGKDDDLLVGDLHVIVQSLHGLARASDVFLCFEVDSYGHFFNKAKTKTCFNTMEPVFSQEFIIDLEGSQTLRILCYENTHQGPILRGKGALELSQSWLTDKVQEKSVSLQELMLTIGLKYQPPELSLRRIPSSKSGGIFGVKIQQVCKKEKSAVPFLVISCIREVEKRGMHEIGIYRVSGSASDVQRLKKSFETNVYEAEQLLKEVDIHSVTGMFKLYLRELPEALFTDLLYQKFFRAFSINNQEEKTKQLLLLFAELPDINRGIILYVLDHLIKIHQSEVTNKMSLHNLATVFGPTLLRPGSRSSSSNPSDLFTAGTVDVMAQAGIFYFFLKRHAARLPLLPENK